MREIYTAAFTQGILYVDKRVTIPLKLASVSLFNKQGLRRRQREGHLEMKLRLPPIISRLFRVFCPRMYTNYPRIKLEQAVWSRNNLETCFQVVTSCIPLQTRSFRVANEEK